MLPKKKKDKDKNLGLRFIQLPSVPTGTQAFLGKSIQNSANAAMHVRGLVQQKKQSYPILYSLGNKRYFPNHDKYDKVPALKWGSGRKCSL